LLLPHLQDGESRRQLEALLNRLIDLAVAADLSRQFLTLRDINPVVGVPQETRPT
jgi:hypothetical protein